MTSIPLLRDCSLLCFRFAWHGGSARCIMDRADLATLASASALASRERWLQLQHLRERAGVDVALFVLGADSRFNRGSEVAFNWLLGSYGGRELLDAAIEKKYDECVVCVGAHRSVIFSSSAGRAEVVARTALWEACEVVALERKEEQDPDVYDIRKLGVFVDMVQEAQTIGVAVQASDLGAADVKMTIEAWPLVQAYAYDELGHGFLTLKKQVVNLESMLQLSAYARWDLQASARAEQLLPKFARVWDEAVQVQERSAPLAAPTAKATGAAGSTAVERLVDFFDYGRLGLSDEDIQELRGLADGDDAAAVAGAPRPRVLLGAASAEISATGAAGTDSGEALHMIWEGVDPQTGIAVARTYALSSTARLAGDDRLDQRLQVLLEASAAALRTCRFLLDERLAHVAFHPDRSSLLAGDAAALIQGEYPHVGARVEVTCLAIDAMGLPVAPAAATAAAAATEAVLLLFLRVALVDVAAPDGQALGAVAFGESAFCVRGAGGVAEVVNVTAPPVAAEAAAWAADWEGQASAQAQAGLDGALGVGLPAPAFVALGHRPGMRVPLEAPAPPPDPLGLGEVVAAEYATSLAIAAASGGVLRWRMRGTAWAFTTGRIVFKSSGMGCLVLEVARGEGGSIPSMVGSNGLVWVAVTASALAGPVAMLPAAAILVDPSLAMAAWRDPSANADGTSVLTDDGSLHWLGRLASADDAASREPQSFLDGSFALAMARAGIGGLAATTPSSAGGHCRCICVFGLPGCRAVDTAARLAKSLGAPLLDASTVPGLGSGAPSHSDPRLREAVATQAAGAAAVVVALEARGGAPRDVAAYLGEVAGDLYVISVVDPLIAYPWSTSRHPLLLSRTCREGVDAVVVHDPALLAAEIGGGRADRERRRALGEGLRHELRAARGSAPVLFSPTTGTLVDGLQQPLSRSPSLGAAAGVAAPGSTLVGVVVELGGLPRDAPALQRVAADALAAAATAAAQPAAERAAREAVLPWRGLFCVEARFLGASGGRDLWCQGAAVLQQSLVSQQFVLSPHGELPQPVHWPAPLAESFGAIWWFALPLVSEAKAMERQHLICEAVRNAMDTALLRPPPPEAPWSGPEEVPAADLGRLEVQAQARELPQGFYFDGGQYIDVDGQATRVNPCLAECVAEFVAAHNAAVEARNALLLEASGAPEIAQLTASAAPVLGAPSILA
eukprot:TRINITY_DN23103_c0_g1_i1.p1 TRINITY_DN23103_c0_g1~~TRINITY_DN23103_c0_g1_i1.p1  ORF type:complete len:1190 (+),score=326.87 TRINITY_DN23103_c0_g1_i1:109-3678(+)